MENTPVDTGEEDVASGRCVWLLDVDGVLNGFGRCGWSAPPATSRIFADGVGWRMRWAPQLNSHTDNIPVDRSVGPIVSSIDRAIDHRPGPVRFRISAGPREPTDHRAESPRECR